MHLPQIALVVARGRNGVIGRDGELPWRLRSDLQRFKSVTMGKPCIMGRATWESLPLKPLPGRLNIVLTRDLSYEEMGKAKGAVVCTSLDEAIEIARETAMDDGLHEICVIGGTALFEAVMPRAKRLYVTEVEASPEGDAWFPPFADDEWEESEALDQPAGEKDDHDMVFRVLERKSA
jgi:dihydrofolate reductase